VGQYIAAIDQGTTGTRCMVFDHSGSAVSAAYLEHAQVFPQPGWVEHDPDEIWRNVIRVSREALQSGGIDPGSIGALGIANQRETAVVWDRRTGKPYGNAIVWQCTRTHELCQRLIDQGLSDAIRQKTGLVVATYFSGTKLQWMLENIEGLRDAAERGDALFGTIDSWLIWNLTGGAKGGVHVSDVTNASRTMMMSLRSLDWDDDLLRVFGVPRAMLPEIRPSSVSAPYGMATGLGPEFGGVPVCGAVGDQQAALVGQTCFAAGEAKNTYGTGSFLLMNTGEQMVESRAGLLTTPAYQLSGDPCKYALEGSIAVTGAAVQWLRDNLGLIETAAESETLAASVADAGGAYFVPAFSGLFAPHWDMYARGVIVGLTRYVTKAHLARATLESICYQSREVLEAMEGEAGFSLTSLRVDGGAVANDLLMQMQSDILGKPVIRPLVRETTALGAAYMAGLGVGYWDSPDDLRQNWAVERRFEPCWEEAQRHRAYTGWQRAVERSKGWLEPAHEE